MLVHPLLRITNILKARRLESVIEHDFRVLYFACHFPFLPDNASPFLRVPMNVRTVDSDDVSHPIKSGHEEFEMKLKLEPLH